MLVEEGVRLQKNRARLGDGMIQYSLRLDHLINTKAISREYQLQKSVSFFRCTSPEQKAPLRAG